MNRLLCVIFTDVRVQFRNKLYSIGIAVSLIVAVGLSQLTDPTQLFAVVPALILLMIGATTMIYAGGLIIFEKEQGTLNATIVSPVTTIEYLGSKVITLTTLATLETLVVIGGAMLIMSRSAEVILPNIPIFLLGVISMGVLYTLLGIILVVRYSQITDYLIPMALVISILQIPFLHFWGIVEHSAFLLIPTSAPTMLMQGAFIELTGWQWGYGLGYNLAVIVGFAIWASHAFNNHIINKVG